MNEHHLYGRPQSLVLDVQVVVTSCWLTVKEASLLLGSLVRDAPVAKVGASSQSLFEAQQLTEVGKQLMHYMGVVKHNGAVEKAQAGFIALCERSSQLPGLPRASANHVEFRACDLVAAYAACY